MLSVYGFCGYLTVSLELYQFNQIKSQDHFVSNAPETTRYFVDGELNRAFEVYHDYVRDTWQNPMKQSNWNDVSSRGNSLTNMHVVPEIKDKWRKDYVVPEVNPDDKERRRRNLK